MSNEPQEKAPEERKRDKKTKRGKKSRKREPVRPGQTFSSQGVEKRG
jgi:hypothetical protein